MRRSSVRHRRSSRLWRSSTPLRPGTPRAPVVSACSSRAASSRACSSRSGAMAPSAMASNPSATITAAAPVPSRRDGTERHRSRRSLNPGSSARSRARSRFPPAAAATEAATAPATPRPTSHSSTTVGATVAKGTWTQRLTMVASPGDRSSAKRMNTVDGGGSSTVFSRAGAALSARWTSGTSRTCRADSKGRFWARMVISRASSTSSEAPDRSTVTRSGWVPARARRHELQVPQPPSGQSNAAASPRAAARFPEPGGPWNRYAWTGWRAAASSRATARSWPTTPANSTGAGIRAPPGPVTGDPGALAASWQASRPGQHLDGVPHLVGDRLDRLGGVHHQPWTGPLASQSQVAVGHPLLEGRSLGLHLVLAVARAAPSGRGHLHREVEQDSEVGLDAAGGPPDQFLELPAVETAPEPLVGEGRGRVAIGDDPAPGLEGGSDHLGYVLGPVGRHQQGLGPWRHRDAVPAEHQVPQCAPERGGPGLEGGDGTEALGQHPSLGGFTAAVDPLQGDQAAPGGGHSSSLVLGTATTGAASCLADAACLVAAAVFAPAFLAAAFLAGAFLAVVFFLAGAFFLVAFFLAGPAARRSASSSAARSTVNDSTSSPRRREALVVPSVT